LDSVMADTEKLPLAQVALLNDQPEQGLARGQVGTVVETLDDNTFLVEFCDDEGRAYALSSCPRETLLPLKTRRLAA